MLLCDTSLKRLIQTDHLVDEYVEDNIQPASVDLRLAEEVILDPYTPTLGSTKEYIKMPPYCAGRIEGRSSFGRVGLIVHLTAGFIDPGFEGNIVLEFLNTNNKTLTIPKNTRVCQLCIEMLDMPSEKVYGECGNHYQGQTGVTESYLNGKYEVQ